MRRETRTRTFTIKTVAAVSLATAETATAHPGVAEHAPLNGPLHGMVHAMMGSPEFIIGAVFALGGLWFIQRFIRRRAGMRAWQRKPE